MDKRKKLDLTKPIRLRYKKGYSRKEKFYYHADDGLLENIELIPKQYHLYIIFNIDILSKFSCVRKYKYLFIHTRV